MQKNAYFSKNLHLCIYKDFKATKFEDEYIKFQLSI